MSKWIISLLILAVTLPGLLCTPAGEHTTEEAQFLNWSDTVGYVGMQTCRSCHKDIYDSFIRTGMGQSFHDATPQKTAASFSEDDKVYDADLDLWYRPYFRNDSMFILEYRLAAGDTTHRREEHIRYIIGSGQHTNSHIIERNGFLYQAPITFYTQRGKWDLAPGFENGFNSRFSRAIGEECMSCHNSLPEMVGGAENKYLKVGKGIDCERCHGPGQLHVEQKLAGIVVDTSKQADPTIVNPRRLSIARQMDLCQRCHLQGISVLQAGKSFADFRPGMELKEHMNIFLPQVGESDQFLMAAHAERLRQSECYKTRKISCITCHDPHVSVKETPIAKFNNTCISCHTADAVCKEDIEVRRAKEDNCTKCHMPSSESIDIPHVGVTDHRIRVVNNEGGSPDPSFITLYCMTDEDPPEELIMQGYLRLFEGFVGDSSLLDAAEGYLAKGVMPFETMVNLYFLKGSPATVVQLDKERKDNGQLSAWTNYRLGESYYQLALYPQALKYHKDAVAQMPLNLEFKMKLGNTYLRLSDLTKGKEEYEEILALDPTYYSAMSNLGFILLNEGRVEEAEQYYLKAEALDPDYIQVLLNLAGLYIMKNEMSRASLYLQRILRIEPDHLRAKQILEQLKHGS